MAELNQKQIKNMQDEFIKLQNLELAIKQEKTKSKKIILKYGAVASLYASEEKIDKMIAELNGILKTIAARGRVRGKVMSIKTMNTYLEKSDRIMHRTRVIDALNRANSARAERRLGLYVMELAKEKSILQADIDLFMARGKVAGLTRIEMLKRLVLAADSNEGPLNNFKKRVESIERDVLRREASASEIDEYRKVLEADEKWEWITISAAPCPDCEIRAGVVLTLDEWRDQGLPGDGHTICRASCMCKLMPYSVAEELFPEVKTFNWNKESGVMTTAMEKRKFGAEKNHGANT